MTSGTLLRFHHVGLACREIAVERAAHASLGFVEEAQAFVDPLQGIRGLFMVHGAFRVELLEPLGPRSPLTPYLERGLSMYHQAFEVDDIAQVVGPLQETGAVPLGEPVPAVAFGGRPVLFVLLPTFMLVELIQAADVGDRSLA